MSKIFTSAVMFFMWCSCTLAEPFSLTQNEQEWLEAHPEIRIGVSLPHPPQSYLDENGLIKGSDPEVVGLLNEAFSGRLKIVTGTWQKVFTDATEKKNDAIMNLTPSEERRAFFNYTNPYMSYPHVIVAKKEGKHFLNLASIKGHTMALIKNSFMMAYIGEHYPDIKIIQYTNSLEALKAVQRGEADATIDASHILNYLMTKHDMKDLDIHGQSVETSETNVIGVRKDWPILVSLLNRALNSISHKKMSAVMNKHNKAGKGKKSGSKINLTPEEQIWIQNHSEIIVGASTDWPPYDYVENGKAEGFANDYMSLLGEKIGLNIKFVHGFDWNELLDQMQQKKIDILPSLAFRQDRLEFMNFTKTYMEISDCLVLHEDTKKIYSLEDMAGKRLAIITGYSVNEVIQKKYPKIKVVYYNSPVEGLVAVSEGRVDGYIDNVGAVNYLRREHFITNLKVVNTQVLEKARQHIGVRKDWPVLKEILEKAMGKVSRDEISELKKTWLMADELDSGKFQLTFSEKQQLKKLKSLRVAISDSWAPFEFTDKDGSFKGISTEYINYIRNRLEIDLKLSSGSWSEIYGQVVTGAVDVIPIISNTEERQEYLGFTKPYMRIPMILGTRSDSPYIAHMDDLKGKTVGVSKGYAIQQRLTRDYPGITIKEYENIEEAMLAVKAEDVSAVIANSADFSYYQNKHGLEKLGINNTTPYESILSIGVRKDLAFLVPVLNRMLDNISSEEHALIMHKWINLPVKKKTDWKMIFKFAGVGLALLLIVLFWNLKLSVEISKRKQVEKNLKASEAKLHSIFKVAPTGIGLVSDRVIQQVNNTMCRITGYSSEELLGENSRILYPTDEEYEVVGQKKYAKIRTQGVGKVETRWQRKDGAIIDVLLSSSPLDSTNISAGVTFTALDITDRKIIENKIKASLREKETLLKEIHHRVKNNMQVISSLLSLQSGSVTDRKILDALTEAESRIRSMAFIHEILYQSKDISKIKFQDYLEAMADHLTLVYESPGDPVVVEIHAHDVHMAIEQAVPCGLIVTELITNSLKYAVINDSELKIKIISKYDSDTHCVMEIEDDGPGLPAGFDPGSSGTLGLSLVTGLITDQLEGNYHVESAGGTRWVIRWPTTS